MRFPGILERLAVPLTAAAAATLVLVAGTALRAPAAGAGEWVALHPAATGPVERPVKVVDDASLDAIGSAGSLLAAAPMEGP